jgi:hypothetical protein
MVVDFRRSVALQSRNESFRAPCEFRLLQFPSTPFRSDDPLVTQSRDGARNHAEPVAKHFGGVFAQ